MLLFVSLYTILIGFPGGLLILVIGFSILPQGHNWIERKFKFKFTWLIKGAFILFLTAFLIPYAQTFTEERNAARVLQQANEAKAAEERERIAKEERSKAIEIDRRAKVRLDSSNFYSSKVEESFKAGQFKSTINHINSALKFSTNNTNLIQKRAESYLAIRQFSDAILDYSMLIQSSYNRSENYYKRAYCYYKIGKKQEAVIDLKQAIELGNKEASKLHEKLNPLKRRIIGYVTRCCDGTTSNSTGRGTCSHHGGVCNWNDPVYQKYREF